MPRRKRSSIVLLLLTCWLLVLGVRCTSSTPTPISAAFPTRVLADLPTRIVTDTPTFTPRPTRTPTPTPTPTVTPTPTITPRPPATDPWFAPMMTSDDELATLDDYWNGEAMWVIEIKDVGLPVGESDTVHRSGPIFWSYLHADSRSAGIRDSCGDSVPYPGCVTLWKSHNGGKSFFLERPECLFPCDRCPCDEDDHVEQQQYPRVFFDVNDFAYMVYEWGAGTFMRTSPNGFQWSGEIGIPGTGVWYDTQRPCTDAERIKTHPNVYSGLEYDCLAGAPPGIYIEDDLLYVFIGLGRAPGHMGCLVGNKYEGAVGLEPCEANPLFGTKNGYGPEDAFGAEANAYFDFRTISSADVVRVGERYYMAYEGTRGPTSHAVREDQFALGFARTISPTIDGPWETFPGNPAVTDVGDYWGIGHADLVIYQGTTYMYSSTSPETRGRYVLVKK